jgi:large subunit ribosomal protein L25
MERFQLQSEPREGVGKGVARQLRMKGRLPAVLYGRRDEPVSLSVSEVEMKGFCGTRERHRDLTIAGGATINAIVRDVQRHPASGKLVHIDLQRIRLDEKLRVEVPVHVTGTPTGVKDQGGILEHGTRSVNVMCLPTEIPNAIEVEVGALKIHDAIKIKDIAATYPKVEFLDDEETMLAGVIPPNVEVAATPVAGAEPTTAEPELIRKPGAEEGEEAATGDKKKDEKKKEDKK